MNGDKSPCQYNVTSDGMGSDEFKELIAVLHSINDGIEGVDLEGVFVPMIEWNFVQLVKTTSFDKALEAISNIFQKYGSHLKFQWRKLRFSVHLKKSASHYNSIRGHSVSKLT